jgi:hypothetical protein
VIHGALAQFSVEASGGGAIPDLLVATDFSIRITAQDTFGNTVLTFNGAGNTVAIADTTGTIVPAVSGNFSNGVRIENNLQILAPLIGDVITVTDSVGGLGTGTETGNSNAFDVSINPAALDHFRFETQPAGPYIAGTGIIVRIYAEDSLNNLITAFNNTATISDSTGTIYENPLFGGLGPGDTTIDFVNGEYNTALNPSLIITGAQQNVLITVSRGGISTDSALFDVQPDALVGFSVEAAGGGNISDQDTDNTFDIDIKALDQYGNVLAFGPNIYDGAGDTVDISDTSGTIETFPLGLQVSGAFTAGQRTETVRITATQAGNVIDVTDTATTTFTGTSNVFDVLPGALAQFIFTTQPAGPYFAGDPIVVRIEARDANNNIKTDYTTGAAVSDDTGTISEGAPNGGDQTIQFFNGVYNNALNPTLFISGAALGVRITVTDVIFTSSNLFDVQPDTLDHFTVEAAGGGNIGVQDAITPFGILITAYDQYDNLLDSGPNIFDGAGDTVNITDPAGSLIPAVSGAFTNGVRTETVQIPKAQIGITIAVTDTATGLAAGVSNVFNVNTGPADRYTFSAIPDPLTAGQTVGMMIEAQDLVGNIVTSYNGTADFGDVGPDNVAFLTDENAYTDAQVVFTNGVWSGNLVTDTSFFPNINAPGFQTQLQLVPNTAPALVAPAIDQPPPFTVNPGTPHHFNFLVGPTLFERVNTIIPVDIVAVDQFDNPVSFDISANIGDTTNTVYESPVPGDQAIQFATVITAPAPYTGYNTGRYQGDFIITLPLTNNVIVVSAGTASGTSNVFSVVSNHVFVRMVNDSAPKVAFGGDKLAMFDFEIENPSPNVLETADLTSMEFFIESSQNGVPSVAAPSSLISSLEIFDVTLGPEVALAVNNTPPSTPVAVAVNTPIVIPAIGGLARFRVYVTIKNDISQAVVPNIQLRIGDILGTFANTGPPPTPIDPTDDLLRSIRVNPYYIRTSLTNIREEETAAFNYPNPFSPNKQQTTIVYFSSSTGQANIKIFTLTGRLVRALTDNANPGSNEVNWDGKNGKGQVVRNGVYVAVILPPGGSKQMVKIAVVK